jgi:RNA polymerase sigma-70 factor (ECF subfamily)
LTALGLEAAEPRERLAAEGAAGRTGRSDEQLMSAVIDRADEASFDELAARHGSRAFRVALAILGGREAAEDALQESFLHMVRARRSFRRGMRFAPWFYTLLRNVCRDELRRRSSRPTVGGERPESPVHADPCEELIRREDCRAACRAFSRLAQADREVLALRVHAGLDFPEVARVLALNEEAAKKRAYRALDRLRRQLAVSSS